MSITINQAKRRLDRLAPRPEPIVIVIEWCKNWGRDDETVVETTEIVSWPEKAEKGNIRADKGKTSPANS